MDSVISQEEAEVWARALYRDAVDQKDAAGFAAVFAQDASLRFGNHEPLIGPAQIESAIAQFFQAMVTLRHGFTAISRAGNTVFLEATVTYERHDGATVTVPAMTVFALEKAGPEWGAQSCRIYVDLAPLFAPTPG